jgi:hypothetical protein
MAAKKQAWPTSAKLSENRVTAVSGVGSEGFWRRDNVEVVCARFYVPLVSTLDDLAAETRRHLSGSK